MVELILTNHVVLYEMHPFSSLSDYYCFPSVPELKCVVNWKKSKNLWPHFFLLHHIDKFDKHIIKDQIVTCLNLILNTKKNFNKYKLKFKKYVGNIMEIEECKIKFIHHTYLINTNKCIFKLN